MVGIRNHTWSEYEILYGRNTKSYMVGIQNTTWSEYKIIHGRNMKLYMVGIWNHTWSEYEIIHGRNMKSYMVGIRNHTWSEYEIIHGRNTKFFEEILLKETFQRGGNWNITKRNFPEGGEMEYYWRKLSRGGIGILLKETFNKEIRLFDLTEFIYRVWNIITISCWKDMRLKKLSYGNPPPLISAIIYDFH